MLYERIFRPMAVIVWQAAYPVLAACILYEISRPDIYPGQKMPVDIIIPWFPQFIRFSLNSNSVIFTVRP
ncbi:MAG: hypothetical protein DRP28_06185 [Thermodesulfobacteriota bacterium]|nr:MAG: hypothetical protein DRP28_06185 [Thermodesulfobacteriota bacterium]